MSYDPRRYWNEVAAHVAGRGTHRDLAGDPGPYHRYKRQLFVRRFLSLIEVEGKSVLELGCGPGGNLLELARFGPRRLAGCDVSAGMLSLAEQTLTGIDVELVQSGERTVPFAAHEFDTAFTVTVLHHNSDDTVAALFAELRRVTRGPLHVFEDTGAEPRGDPDYVLRTVEEYEQLASTSGWRMVSARPLDIYASELAYRLIDRRWGDRGRAEGAAIPLPARVLARVMVTATRPLNLLIPQRRGPTPIPYAPADM